MATVNHIDILKTDAPVAEFYTHMNVLFLLLEQNSECFRGQNYTTLTVVVTSYAEDADGELNPNVALGSWSNTFAQHDINNRISPDGFPPYNIWVDLENYWYRIQLNFNFEYNADGAGTNAFSSKFQTYDFDNRKTTLTNQESSTFFTGLLRDNLQKDNEFSVWFGDPQADYKLWDLVGNINGSMIKQVTNVSGVFPNQIIQLLPTEENYQGMVEYILNHERFHVIFERYYQGSIPEHSVFSFLLYLNGKYYLIHFRGDLREIGGSNIEVIDVR